MGLSVHQSTERAEQARMKLNQWVFRLPHRFLLPVSALSTHPRHAPPTGSGSEPQASPHCLLYRSVSLHLRLHHLTPFRLLSLCCSQPVTAGVPAAMWRKTDAGPCAATLASRHSSTNISSLDLGLISSWLYWQHSLPCWLQVMIQGFTLFASQSIVCQKCRHLADPNGRQGVGLGA